MPRQTLQMWKEKERKNERKMTLFSIPSLLVWYLLSSVDGMWIPSSYLDSKSERYILSFLVLSNLTVEKHGLVLTKLTN